MFWRWLVPQQFESAHRLYLNSSVLAFSFPLHHFLDILESRATGRVWHFSFSAVYRHTQRHTHTQKPCRYGEVCEPRMSSSTSHARVAVILVTSLFFFLMKCWSSLLSEITRCSVKAHRCCFV